MSNQISQPSNNGGSQVAKDGIWSHLRIAVVATVLLGVLVSGIYPLIVWGLAQVVFPQKANGSLIVDRDGHVLGSRLIGQGFSDPKYFHPRPSAAGSGYDGTASSGSNLGPMSAKLINGTTKPSTQPTVVADYDGIQLRVLHYCDDNGIAFSVMRDGQLIAKEAFHKEFKIDSRWEEAKLILAFNDTDHTLSIKPSQPVPADAVTASASGLDPHISTANAKFQSARIAKARGISEAQVQRLIEEHTDEPDLGIFGDAGVNVLMLNLVLDSKYPVPTPATQSAR